LCIPRLQDVFAMCILHVQTAKLFANGAGETGRLLNNSKAQQVANATWASATVTGRDEKLFADCAEAAERLLSNSRSPQVANTAWPRVSICNNYLLREEAVRRLGGNGGAAAKQLQRAAGCQHSMGICNNDLPRQEAVRRLGGSGRPAA